MATCTLIQASGFPCVNESDPTSFFDICSDHWAQIIEEHNTRTTDRRLLAKVQCPVCHRSIPAGPGVPVACSNPHCWEDAWWNAPAPDADVPARRGTDWVYYIRFGNRIKIGTSSNLKGRLSTLPYDEVLAIEPGSYDLERLRHAAFAEYRIDGQAEWFRDTEDLREHIHQLQELHGAPADLMRAA